MAVRDIEYVELYTSDQSSTVGYLTAKFGFTVAAQTATDDLESVLLRQGSTRILVTAGRNTWKFLDEHGDGIADIALVCDNVMETRDTATTAGATPGRSWRGDPTVSGFGDVVHTLVPRAALPSDAANRLPSGAAWTTTPGAGPGAVSRIQRLDHIAVCLEGGTLAEFADFYRDGFGLERYSTEYVSVGEQAMDSIVVREPAGRVTFTFVAPDPVKGSGQLDGFLRQNSGPGVQHLAFLVDEIIPAVSEFRGRGVEFLKTLGTYYDMLADRFTGMAEEVSQLRATHVLADRDEWGYLLQLFTRSPYERGTLFYELIQRRGSKGFGSRNIRALYEAVERDRAAAE